jgi:hypothetical protein
MMTDASPAMSCLKLYWSPTTHKIKYDRASLLHDKDRATPSTIPQ